MLTQNRIMQSVNGFNESDKTMGELPLHFQPVCHSACFLSCHILP